MLETHNIEDAIYDGTLRLGGEEWFFLGEGADRIVFHNGALVIKFPNHMYHGARSNANGVEFEVYNMVVGTPAARHLAPTLALLDEYREGDVLVAVKVSGSSVRDYTRTHVTVEDKLRHLLAFFGIGVSDTHPGNFVGSRVIDYGRFYFY